MYFYLQNFHIFEPCYSVVRYTRYFVAVKLAKIREKKSVADIRIKFMICGLRCYAHPDNTIFINMVVYEFLRSFYCPLKC